MDKQVRDWNKDKEEINQFMDGWFPGGASNTKSAVLAFFYFAKEALPYYHQQYASAEAREKKLREAIEEIKQLGYSDRWGGGYIYTGESHATAVRIAARILASLYPEEGTPQIKPLNNEDMQASQAFINRAMR